MFCVLNISLQHQLNLRILLCILLSVRSDMSPHYIVTLMQSTRVILYISKLALA